MAIGLGRMFGFRFTGKLQLALCLQKHYGILAALAHLPVHLVPGLCVFPAGRQPGGAPAGSWLRNLFVVWLLTGVWHGANWTFIAWGMTVFCAAGAGKAVRPGKALARLGRACVHAADGQLRLGAVPRGGHRRGGAVSAGHVRARTAGGKGSRPSGRASSWCFWRRLTAGAAPFAPWLRQKVRAAELPALWNGLYVAALLALFVVVVVFLAKGTYNPFIYFNF